EEPGAAPATFVADVLDPAAGPAVRLLSSVITDALAKRASDIHVEATGAALLIKYRIDGVLYEGVDPLDPAHHGAVVARLKVMAELDLAESRVPQDGRFRLKANGKEVDFRVSILPSIHGEDAVIRILDREAITAGVSELRLERLGFPEADLARFRRTIAEPYGMVLVTGPTGSGKTTTLYAAISEINTGEEKIITIEDPVEYELPGVVQIPVNEKKGLTFARGLRSVLRHDPDKILVGEIRDPETAQIAVQSALTGHLVFTTVHANNAFDVIGRFLNMGIEPYNFVSSLSGILAQRLVRVLCAHCKRAAEPDAERLRASGLTPDSLPGPIFDAAGCPECHGTGYRGRLAITEYLVLTDAIREMIVGRRPSTEIRKEALAGGMTTLRQSAVAKVAAGITTLREIDRVTFVE
ncbi:MAG: type II/IV secretion system protein, partial [Nitrospirae bacterium]|nr:type II/IV secretion system protein [Nitrospirota bacterium]